MDRWISMARSGVKKWYEPSMCDLNFTPSSFIFLLADKEYTWYPPESVKMGFSHPINL